MNKFIFFVILISLSCKNAWCNSAYLENFKIKQDSGIIVNDENIKQLAVLGKVWGILKYYHPTVTSGQVDWDQQLFKLLPSYLDCKSQDERNILLQNWISGLGDISKFPHFQEADVRKIRLRPDLEWIKKSRFSAEIIRNLNNVQHNPDTVNGYYAKLSKSEDINFITITHEKSYSDVKSLTDQMKLLAVFRYWNVIAYWYPYRYLIKPEWDQYLETFIHDALLAKTENEFTLFVQKMIATIKDSHAVANSTKIDASNGKWQMPISVKFVESKAVISSIDSSSLTEKDIHVGDVLVSVNGVPLQKLIDKKKILISASNNASLMRDVAKLITRQQDTVSEIVTTNRAGKTNSYRLKNLRYNSFASKKVYDFSYQRDSSYFIVDKSILYINIGNLKREQIPQIKAILNKVKGIIFDDRQYPKDPAGDLISNLLLPRKMELAKFTSVVKGHPGLFEFSKPMIIGSDNSDYFKGKVIILVNEQTQSTGEFLAMSMKLSPNSKVLGSTTSGADGNVMPPFPLPGGYYTSMTGIGVYYPDGTETQQVGIVPDIVVSQHIDAFRKNRDELLERAVEVINE